MANLLRTIHPPPNTLWNKSALHALQNITKKSDFLTHSGRPLHGTGLTAEKICAFATVTLTILREGISGKWLFAKLVLCFCLPSLPVNPNQKRSLWYVPSSLPVFTAQFFKVYNLRPSICGFCSFIESFGKSPGFFFLFPQDAAERNALSEVAHTSKRCPFLAGVLSSSHLISLTSTYRIPNALLYHILFAC